MKRILALLCTVSIALAETTIGDMRVIGGGVIAIEEARMQLQLAEPGWKMTVQDERAERIPGGTADAFSVPLTLSQSKRTVTVNASIRKVHENGMHLRLSLDTAGAELISKMYIISIPIDVVAGNTASCDGTAFTLPREFSGKYPLAARSMKRLSLPVGDGTLIIAGSFTASVQDNREFKGTTFEARIALDPSDSLSLAVYFRPKNRPEPDVIMPPLVKAAARSPYAQQGALGIRTEGSATAAQFGRFEAVCAVSASFNNPFNPDEIRIDAEFKSPSGQVQQVPGFFRQEYRIANGTETAGTSSFLVRFSPRETGRYKYRVTVTDRQGSVTSDVGTFESTPSTSKGFVRVSRKNPHYFAFDDGTSFWPVGMNVCWDKNVFIYEKYFRSMAENGATFARIWLSPFVIFTLERSASGKDDPAGIGMYDQRNAARIDHILALAERYGIRLQLCIESFNSLKSSKGNEFWQKFPYNTANGGMCSRPEEFFTSEAAKTAFKKRLRYLVARYGYSTHVFSWEFFNEVCYVDNYEKNKTAIAAWHAEMARYLAGIDVNRHLMTTSQGGYKIEGSPETDGIAELDYIQRHRYIPASADWFIQRFSSHLAGQYGKPAFFGEFGADNEGHLEKNDIEGVQLHNGLWGSLFANNAASAMFWWWDKAVEPLSLYRLFKPIASFSSAIDLANRSFVPVTLSFESASDTEKREQISFEGGFSLFTKDPSNEPQSISIADNLSVSGDRTLSTFLHGISKKDLANPVTWTASFSSQGRFTVHVRKVSDYGGAALRIRIDGNTVLEKEFADMNDTKDPMGMTMYNGAYAVDVPAGRHSILVENTGNDWIQAGYTLDIPTRAVPLVGYALADHRGNDVCYVWIRHRAFTYQRYVEQNERPDAVRGVTARLNGFSADTYRAAWIDTRTGAVLRIDDVTAAGGVLALPVPQITKDIACRITRT